MEAERPHFDWPLDQLVEYADQHARNRPVLTRVLDELAHRPGSRAKLLARRVERRLAAIEAAPRPETGTMRAALVAAAEEIESLRQRLADAERQLEAQRSRPSPPNTPDGLHAEVFLTPRAPYWLVTEARRAFRRRYHPDLHAEPAARRRAEAAFKHAEAVFRALPAAPED